MLPIRTCLQPPRPHTTTPQHHLITLPLLLLLLLFHHNSVHVSPTLLRPRILNRAEPRYHARRPLFRAHGVAPTARRVRPPTYFGTQILDRHYSRSALVEGILNDGDIAASMMTANQSLGMRPPWLCRGGAGKIPNGLCPLLSSPTLRLGGKDEFEAFLPWSWHPNCHPRTPP